MSTEIKKEIQLEIAHLLFIDVVGYSKLLVNEQIELMQQLNRIVRGTECFREAEASGKLIRLPTGDGMVLLFFRSPEQPVRCALEISQALRSQTHIQLRMGVHSGPVNQVVDVNDQMNIAGAGINVGQRVMDCGDAGHILLSKHVADDLTHYRQFRFSIQPETLSASFRSTTRIESCDAAFFRIDKGISLKQNLVRSTAWEIHPVMKIEVIRN